MGPFPQECFRRRFMFLEPGSGSKFRIQQKDEPEDNYEVGEVYLCAFPISPGVPPPCYSLFLSLCPPGDSCRLKRPQDAARCLRCTSPPASNIIHPSPTTDFVSLQENEWGQINQRNDPYEYISQMVCHLSYMMMTAITMSFFTAFSFIKRFESIMEGLQRK